MAQTFGTNSNNDIYIGADGNLAILTAAPATLGACATASKAQLGEMVLAITSGIPTFQTVWTGRPNLLIFESYLRKTLKAVVGVTDVKSLTTSVVDGALKYTAVIQSVYGPLTVNG